MDYIALAFSLVAFVLSAGAYVGQRAIWDKHDLNKFSESLSQLERVLDRMELATFVVAADLTTAKSAVATVATNLEESQRRADDVIEGQPGEAADAGAQSGTVAP